MRMLRVLVDVENRELASSGGSEDSIQIFTCQLESIECLCCDKFLLSLQTLHLSRIALKFNLQHLLLYERSIDLNACGFFLSLLSEDD
jgi:hypothetical protein